MENVTEEEGTCVSDTEKSHRDRSCRFDNFKEGFGLQSQWHKKFDSGGQID